MNFINISLFTCLLFVFSGNVIANEKCTTGPTSSLIVSVKSNGAKGDGVADDTAAVQASIKQVAGTGGTVLVPAGTYMINALTSISIKNKMTFRMAEGAVLKAIPNGKTNYSIITINAASDINVIGGTLIGDRNEHTGVSGEWGMGITLRGATNVAIEGVTVKNAWGDGFYITGASKNVKFCSVVADNNRRQGMSIISVDGMVVNNSIFKNTGGTAPQAGIDVEPNEDDIVSNVQILNSHFIDNNGPGILLYVSNAKRVQINNTTIDGNFITGNRHNGLIVSNTFGHRITNNSIADNKGGGLLLSRGAKRNTITRNKFKGEGEIKNKDENSVFENIFE